MDHENYGRSSRTAGNSDVASGVADLVAATELVIRETHVERIHLWIDLQARCVPPRSPWSGPSGSTGSC
jgi:hypothetical protein